MTRSNSLTPFALSLTLALLLSACKDTAAQSTTPEEAASGSNEASGVPQEPDPQELGVARTKYLRGDYKATIDLLQPLFGDLKEREQLRASGLAGAWLALALARDVAEQAESPAQYALEMAEQTSDDEVLAVAKLAVGAFMTGSESFDGAIASLEQAAEGSAAAADGALASVLLAEAFLGRAYDGGDELRNPEDLDRARQAYERALEVSGTLDQGSGEAASLQGRAHEGLAAVAKYQGAREKICSHSKAASAAYEKAAATEFLREGPTLLYESARCSSNQ